VSPLEHRAIEKISEDYPPADCEAVVDLLACYSGRERDRVIWDILQLSKGDSQKLLEFIHCAQRDYRDVLYWAEYFDTDPMLKGRDPKKLVEDLLARWGTKAADSPRPPRL
jgi:hypothetical protein